jgi:ABC-type glycerol-3-phosphate transport system substrate-binding protein
MKRNLRFISLILAAVCVTAFAFTGCGPNTSSSVTELRVWNYDGGVGHAWLDEVIKRFETDNVNTSYEDGKTGVKIRVTNTKDTNQLNNIKTANHSVYFAQGIRYNGLQADGTLLNISDVARATLPGENKSIESKLSSSPIGSNIENAPSERLFSSLYFFNTKSSFLTTGNKICFVFAHS